MMKMWFGGVAALALAAQAMPAAAQEGRRWTPAEAKAWYAKQRWMTGANYLPGNAINQLEMWQAATFDPASIDRELAMAEALGMNTMRVFLHDLLWQQDPEGFKQRINTFLDIAKRHNIKPMLVLFDSCWDPDPKLGPQRPPIPGVHNSGWVQGPGRAALEDPAQLPRLKAYVEGVVGAFAKDDRILAWDVWNEPDNTGGGNYDSRQPRDKVGLVARMLPQVFEWTRSQRPIQPLTSGVWQGDDWTPTAKLNAVQNVQLSQSDFTSFHDYGWPEQFEGRVRQLEAWGRPIVCTEYMARGNGSTFDGSLPIAKRRDVGMINWGFIEGRSQTYFPWDSWQKPYVESPPIIWFHDVLRADGSPYRRHETEMLKAYAKAPRRELPAD